MTKSIEDVKGIGPVSASLIKEAGIGTVSELAAATIERIASIKGFSGIRAARVIENAKTLLEVDNKPAAPAPPAKTESTKPSSEKKKKTDTKKKDKKGGKKKKDKKKATQKDSKKKKGNKKGKKKK